MSVMTQISVNVKIVPSTSFESTLTEADDLSELYTESTIKDYTTSSGCFIPV